MVHSIFLKQDEETQNVKLKLFAAYAYKIEKNIPKEFAIGEGLGWTVRF